MKNDYYFIFDEIDENWLKDGDNMERLDKSIVWAECNPRRDTFEEIIENDKSN